MQKVRIISIPPGEAPEEIRKEWIGVIMPLSELQPTQEELVRSTKGISGDTTPPKKQVQGGFVVDIVDALEALDKSGKKKAANWWRRWVEINFPKMLGGQLVFARSCGELIDD